RSVGGRLARGRALMRPTSATRRAGRGRHATAVGTLLDEAHRAERAGQRELARRRYESALYLLRSDTDAEEASMILRRIGRLYLASLAGYRTLGLDHCVANLLNDIGLAYADLGRWDDAESTYREALSLCELCSDASTALMVDVNRAATRIARGDYVDAQVVCERVLQEARPLNDIRVLSEVYKHCG